MYSEVSHGVPKSARRGVGQRAGCSRTLLVPIRTDMACHTGLGFRGKIKFKNLGFGTALPSIECLWLMQGLSD